MPDEEKDAAVGLQRVMSNYIWAGTKQELLQWLDQEEYEGELQQFSMILQMT